MFTDLSEDVNVDMVVKAGKEGSSPVPCRITQVTGEEYRIELTIFNESTRHHVALVDHLPAGFEHSVSVNSFLMRLNSL